MSWNQGKRPAQKKRTWRQKSLNSAPLGGGQSAPASQPRRRHVDWEGQEQMALIRWLHGEKMRGQPVGELYDAIYHPPNGGARHKKTAVDMKRQGVKSGVSDLVVRQARGGWHGLYLELKATPPKNADLADSQREWLEGSEYEGYCSSLALGFEEAKAVLREYASWPRTQVMGGRLALMNGTDWRRGTAMGIAATAMQGSDVDYQRIGIWTLRELARQSHEDHDPDAARVFVSRILDIEVERRTVHEHHNQGWHSHSPCAPGLAPGGTAIAREPLAALYDRGIYTHEQHEAAHRWIDAAGIKPRQLLAALIQAAKLHPRAVSNTPWTKSYDHIAEHIDWYAKALGFVAVPGSRSRTAVREVQRPHRNNLHVWPMPADRVDVELAREETAGYSRKIEEQQEERVPVFKHGEALRQAGKVARVELKLLAMI